MKEEPKIDKEWQDKIEKIRDYSEKEFDRLIVYLSSGALILTIGFVKNIISISECTDTTLLKLSWICFAFSLLFMLTSHKVSIHSMNLELKGKEEKSDICDIWTNILNWGSYILLFIGITLFIIFIYNKF
jgi:hypothetical protein